MLDPQVMADKPRMNDFLRQHLEDPEYREQLQWVDWENLTFRVLWMHAGRATFVKERHQKLFYKYRKYRGEGWKSEFCEGKNEWGSGVTADEERECGAGTYGREKKNSWLINWVYCQNIAS